MASRALAQAVEHFPDMPVVELDCAGMPPEEVRLAVAIHRTALQRFLTLEYLLNRHLKQKLARLEPALQGVLLAGAAQILFMDRLPVYAVVDESVALARRQVRPGAAGIVNAVLRRLAALAGSTMPDVLWAPAADRLPRDPGAIALGGPVLPDPRDVAAHLAVSTSHPRALVGDWLEAFGPQAAAGLLAHSIKQPPTFVQESDGACAVWEQPHEALVAYLAADPGRRVQDPTAARAVAATARLDPARILDRCAGRGTKTRQLAAIHPGADVVAADPDPERFEDLAQLARSIDRVEAVAEDAIGDVPFDLVVLDVPCSNSGVFARRPEARYRYSGRSLASVAALQRRIIERAAQRVAPGGHLLYATCSIHTTENQTQAAAAARILGGQIVDQKLTLPGGHGPTYHDGGYFALIRCPGAPVPVAPRGD